jgi:phospholipase/lecithinase/hemolysin
VLADGEPQITEIVVFGDSHSDTGNLHLATGGFFAPPPAYLGGRWSNGPLWHEIVANGLGVTAPAPDIIGGTNYAWGGAETGEGFSAFGTPNLGVQIDTFLAGNNPRVDQLFIVQGAGNDIVLFRPGGPKAPEEVVDNIAAHITELASAGAEFFVVPNLHLLGNSPGVASLGDEAVKQQNKLVGEFDRLLRQRLRRLEKDLAVVIVKPSWLATFELLLRFPQLIEVEDTTGTAKLVPGDFTDGAVVDNPNSFFWLDDPHPTAPVHEAVGEFTLFRIQLRLDD